MNAGIGNEMKNRLWQPISKWLKKNTRIGAYWKELTAIYCSKVCFYYNIYAQRIIPLQRTSSGLYNNIAWEKRLQIAKAIASYTNSLLNNRG